MAMVSLWMHWRPFSTSTKWVFCSSDEDLALIVEKFTHFYNNWQDRRRGGSRTCYECGDTTHFKAVYPKLKKKEDRNHDHDKHMKNKKYFLKNHDKMAKKAVKVASWAFVVALSDIDTSSSEDESSEEEEPSIKNKKKIKDFTGLCFMADNNDNDPELDSSEVSPSYD